MHCSCLSLPVTYICILHNPDKVNAQHSGMAVSEQAGFVGVFFPVPTCISFNSVKFNLSTICNTDVNF